MKWFIILGIVFGLFVVPGVYGAVQNITAFNDSVSQKNITFLDLFNTSYIELPKDAHVINGTMNFTGNVTYPANPTEMFSFNATHQLQGEGLGLSPNGEYFVGYGLPRVDFNYTFYVLNISGCFDNGWTDPSCILNSFLLDYEYKNAQGDVGVSNQYFWIRETDIGDDFYVYDFDGIRINSWSSGIDTCKTTGIAYDKINDDLYVITSQFDCGGKLYIVGDPVTGTNITTVGDVTLENNAARTSIELDYDNNKIWGVEGDAIFRTNMSGNTEFATYCYADSARCNKVGDGFGLVYAGDKMIYVINESGDNGITKIQFNVTDVVLDVDGEILFTFPDDLDSSIQNSLTAKFFHENHAGGTTYSWSVKKAVLNIDGINNYLDGVCTDDPCTIPINFTTDYANDLFFNVNMAGTIYYNFPFLSECDGVSNIEVLNFDLLTEDNFTSVNGTFEASFESIIPGNIENTSFDLNGSSNYTLCIDNTTDAFNVNGTIKYSSVGFSDRWYYLVNTPISNISFINFNLYLLEDASSTFVEFEIQDSALQPQQDIVLKINRYYPGNDTYLTVAMGLTGYDGKVTIPLKLLEYYNLLIERNGVLLTTIGPQMISTNELLLAITSPANLIFYEFSGSLTSSCSYNNITFILSCSLSDSSGCLQDAYLDVKQRLAFNNSVIVCADIGAGPAASLTCDITGYTNNTLLSYNLRGEFQCSPIVNYSVISDWLDFTSPFVGWGQLGILMAFMIVITLGFMGLWSPTMAIMLSFSGIVISFWIGLLPIQYGSIVAMALSVGILIFRLKR